MARPKELDFRIPKTLSFDAEIYKKYEEQVGSGNVSESLREYMKREVERETRKKVEAPQNKEINPIGLPRYDENPTLDTYVCINELFAQFENNIIDKIDKEKDTWNVNRSIESLQRLIKRLENKRKMIFKQSVILVHGKVVDRSGFR